MENTSTLHRRFAAACFNEAWDLLEKADRTPEEDLRMLEASFASLYHWRQREDVGPANLSIGYWQVARILSVLGHGAEARRYARLSASYAEGQSPFLQGYAAEAQARAAWVDGQDDAKTFLRTAEAWAAQVTESEDRSLLEADLRELRAKMAP